jgi:hypothetical protein
VVLHAFGLDDVLITIATLIGAATTAGHHLKIAPLQEIYAAMARTRTRAAPPEMRYLQARSVRATYGSNQAYVFELMFIKLAVLAFYYRVAVSKKHRMVLYITAALVIGYCISHNFVYLFFYVRPIRSAWDINVKKTKIFFTHRDIQNANSIFQSVIDVILLLYPIPILIRLNTNRRTKIGLAFIFSLGIFSLVATLVRLSRAITFSRIHNYIFHAAMEPELTLWTLTEVNTAIICANLPAISALFRGFGRSNSTNPSGPPGEKASEQSEKRALADGSSGSSSSNSQVGFSARMGGTHPSATISATVVGGGDKSSLKDPSIFIHERDLGDDIDAISTPSNRSGDGTAGHGITTGTYGGITRTTDFRMDIEKGEKAEFL